MTTEERGLVLYSLEDLKGKTPVELRSIVEKLDEKIRELHQLPGGDLRDLNEDESKALNVLIEVREAAMTKLSEHQRISDVLRTKPQSVQTVFSSRMDDAIANVRSLTNAEARDKALRILDSKGAIAHLKADQKDQVERHVRRNTDIARRLLVTENDEYRDAWMKLVTDPQPFLEPEEQRAVQAWKEYRAMSEGTSAAGGYGIPVLIDPSIILTAQGSGNPFLELARQVDINTNVWKGVSSAGVSWSFDAEATEVSDDSPTLAQPSVTVYMARGFIPYSIELGQDYPSFAEEMSNLLAAGYDELLVDKFSRGSGTGEPFGILTALDANTNVEVTSTTDGAFGQEDIYKVWKSLPQRYRRQAAWMMSVDVNNKIRQMGTANVFHAYTENLPAEWADELFGKQVYESPYFPDFTGTTGAENRLVVGDWTNYVIARRGGMSVELVPHLIGLTNNRPTGQRGWFAYARIGGNSANDLGFRLLQNQ
jgi:HK97 family phage major capsid protein